MCENKTINKHIVYFKITLYNTKKKGKETYGKFI